MECRGFRRAQRELEPETGGNAGGRRFDRCQDRRQSIATASPGHCPSRGTGRIRDREVEAAHAGHGPVDLGPDRRSLRVVECVAALVGDREM